MIIIIVNIIFKGVNFNTSSLGWEEEYLSLLKAFRTLRYIATCITKYILLHDVLLYIRECLEKSPNAETCSVLAARLTEYVHVLTFTFAKQ